MNSPINTHVKLRQVHLKPLGDGQVVKENTGKVKVMSIQDWKKVQGHPPSAKNFEFIEEIPMPDATDVLIPEATGGSETGAYKRYQDYIANEKGRKDEITRKAMETEAYNTRKENSLREMISNFTGKQQLHLFLASQGISGDISANMIDEVNMGTFYEKYHGDLAAMDVAIANWKKENKGGSDTGKDEGTDNGGEEDAEQRAQAIKSWNARFKSKKQLGEFAAFCGKAVDGSKNMLAQCTELYDAFNGEDAEFNKQMDAFSTK